MKISKCLACGEVFERPKEDDGPFVCPYCLGAYKEKKFNYKFIFRPICMMTCFYYALRYDVLISGHDFIEREDGCLECKICGEESK